MDSGVERLFGIAGDHHKYQFIIVLMTFFLWIVSDLMLISLPYLEDMPIVRYNLADGTEIIEKLTTDICAEYPNFKIIKSQKYSWVSDYKIECDKFHTSLIGTSLFFGFFIGALFFKTIADSLGRNRTIYVFTFLFGTFLLLLTFQFKNLKLVYIILVMIQFFNCLITLSSYLLCAENITKSLRSLCGAIINSAYTICAIVFILLYKFLDSWKIPFYLAAFLSIIISLMFYFFVLESARFYFIHNKTELFLENLRKISIINNRKAIFDYYVPHNSISSDNSEIKIKNIIHDFPNEINYDKKEIEIILNALTNQEQLNKLNIERKSAKQAFLYIIKYKSIRSTFLIMCLSWMGVSGNYYGITINLKNLPGDIFNNGIILYSIDGIGYITSSFLINIPILGRKHTMLIFYLISAFINLSIYFFQIKGTYLIVLTMIVRFCISSIFNILYTYSTEVYPTIIRSFGISWNSMFARLSAMIFPFAVEYYGKYLYLFFAFLNFFLFVVNIFLKETFGIPMKDNIEEEETDNEFIKKIV